MPDERYVVRLPQVHRLTIRHMSLYRDKPLVDVEFGDGVFCLAGANGLGKSTFLATLNYAMTGIVADPDQKFASLKEYHRDSLAFSRDYFAGRVEELDREMADVTIHFSIGGRRYALTRGMFAPKSLRRLEIVDSAGAAVLAQQSEDEAEGATLHERYVASIIQDSGLATFEQFVFLQHFLLTFDERRHLLFWDPEVARQTLYLAFGVDGNLANQADEWLRKSDRLESQARNAQYQATTARQRIKELTDRMRASQPTDDGLVDQYREVMGECDRAAEQLKTKVRAAEDARYKYTVAAANLHAMNADYDRLFSENLSPGADPAQHSVVHALVDKRECPACGSHGPSVAEHAADCLNRGRCPLCLAPITSRRRHTADGFEKLEQLDAKIAQSRAQVRAAEEAASRLSIEVDQARANHEHAVAIRTQFEQANVDIAMDSEPSDSSTVAGMVHQLEAERANAFQRRDEFRRRRDEYRRRLEPVQRELATRYLGAEREFLPRFQRLAHEFLGLDLQVNMEQRSRGPELSLTIDGTRRRMTTQLSESQRYFVDIALRMALAEHLCRGVEPACLFIDTPEGSLDIAYESRAGRMFGRFVRADNRLVVTANINSSRLVQELARVCGSELMRVERMTDWTTLSEVQAESEDLFDEAYAQIEQALTGGQSQ